MADKKVTYTRKTPDNVRVENVGAKLENLAKLNDRWWSSDKPEVPNNVASVVNAIDENQSYKRLMNEKYARLYSNVELSTFLTGNGSSRASDNISSNRVTYNVIKSAIDTANSKIAKNKPKVQFLTEDGDFALKTRAENLTKYVEGVFYDTNVYKHAQKMFTHAMVFGTGCMKVYTEDGKIKTENVFTEEIKIDDIEGAYGKPQQLHQVKHVSRDVLIANYPDSVDAILEADGTEISRFGAAFVSDRVKVTESWHLRSGSDTKDGRHCITIQDDVLFDEEYTKDYFPFVFMRWSDRLAGFFGQGLAEELIGIQIEINKLLKSIQKAQHLIAIPRIAVDAGTTVSASVINNEIGSIFKYAGNSPSFFTPTAMNAEVYNHLKWLIQSAYEVSGISQLSATSKKPAGLDAAVALREFQDIETERFMTTAQSYEKIFMDLAEIVIDMSRDMYEVDPNISTKVQTSKFIKTLILRMINL